MTTSRPIAPNQPSEQFALARPPKRPNPSAALASTSGATRASGLSSSTPSSSVTRVAERVLSATPAEHTMFHAQREETAQL